MAKAQAQSGRVEQQVPASRKKNISPEEFAKVIRKQRDRDREIVVGIFKNLENPATNGSLGILRFGYKGYPGDEYIMYELRDGERYSLPRGVARHLNNNCFYREYKLLEGQFGEQGMRGAAPDPNGRLKDAHFQASRKVHRFAFHSAEFMDDNDEMYPVDLIEVSVNQ